MSVIQPIHFMSVGETKEKIKKNMVVIFALLTTQGVNSVTVRGDSL